VANLGWSDEYVASACHSLQNNHTAENNKYIYIYAWKEYTTAHVLPVHSFIPLRDQPNSGEKMHNFTVGFLKYAKFHGAHSAVLILRCDVN